MFMVVAANEQQLCAVADMQALQHAKAFAFHLTLPQPEPEHDHDCNDKRQDKRQTDDKS